MSALVGLVIGECRTRLWGMSGEERARRTLQSVGAGQGGDGALVMLRADWVVDPALVGLVKAHPNSVLVSRGVPVAAHGGPEHVEAIQAGQVPAGLKVIEHEGGVIYLPNLRKRLDPALLPLTPETVRAAEKATFKGSYKGVTDLVTKYVWPLPARLATRWCAEKGVTPNMVTLTSLAMVMAAMAAFWQGWFAAGLAAAWVMTFLDTVDGKLARVTLTSTKFGNVFDHGIDLIHPPFWWWAWHVGCLKAGAAYPWPETALLVTLAGYVVLRLQEGVFLWSFGLTIHVWRRFDSLFRMVVARRNPNLLLLTIAVALGQPGWGMVAVAAWTALSVLVHGVQMVQALMARRAGVRSWLAG